MYSEFLGLPIYPNNLNRVLGINFFTVSQFMKNTHMTRTQVESAVQDMLHSGVLEEWLASECTECKYVWPEVPNNDTSKPKTIICPICNTRIDPVEVQFYQAYKLLK